MDLTQAVNLAAEKLPVGYEIIITVEKNGYGVVLCDKYCKESNVDGGDGLVSDILEAIDLSIEDEVRYND